MAELGVDALLLSVGPELPYLTGYEAMPLERLTMLVLPRTATPSSSSLAWRFRASRPDRSSSRSCRGRRPTTRSRWLPE